MKAEIRSVCYATIVDPDYLHFAVCMLRSIRRYHPFNPLVVACVVTGRKHEVKREVALPKEVDGIGIIDSRILEVTERGCTIAKKYRNSVGDQYRWSMKSLLLEHLLEMGAPQVVFCDPDLYFFSDISFVEDLLAGHTMVLSPHWRVPDPSEDEKSYRQLQQDGMFNAGFVGVTRRAKKALAWWANCCAYKCADDRQNGYFADQRYLNLVPVYFNDIEILKHKGCNVAAWNRKTCIRVVRPGGTIGIEYGSPVERWPLVFIHFTRSTIRAINRGEDPLLEPHLAEYEHQLDAASRYLCDHGLKECHEGSFEFRVG